MTYVYIKYSTGKTHYIDGGVRYYRIVCTAYPVIFRTDRVMSCDFGNHRHRWVFTDLSATVGLVGGSSTVAAVALIRRSDGVQLDFII